MNAFSAGASTTSLGDLLQPLTRACRGCGTGRAPPAGHVVSSCALLWRMAGCLPGVSCLRTGLSPACRKQPLQPQSCLEKEKTPRASGQLCSVARGGEASLWTRDLGLWKEMPPGLLLASWWGWDGEHRQHRGQQCVALAGQPACPQETVHILSLAQSTAGLWIQPREDPSGRVSLEITCIVLCIEDLTSPQISLPKNVGSVSLSCSR